MSCNMSLALAMTARSEMLMSTTFDHIIFCKNIIVKTVNRKLKFEVLYTQKTNIYLKKMEIKQA